MPRTAPSVVVTIGAAPELEAAAVAPPVSAALAPAAVRVNDTSTTPQTAASEARHERDVVMTLALSRTCGSPQVELGLAARCVVYPQRPSPCGPSPLWIALGFLFGFPGISLGRGREEPHRTRGQILSSGSSGDPGVPGQRRPELPARGDTELGEHVAQVPLDRARADEQLRADLRVRQAVAGQPGDLLLLRRELVARVGASLAHLLARREELAAGALGERLHPDRGEQVVGRT